jgi:hypothetical protein
VFNKLIFYEEPGAQTLVEIPLKQKDSDVIQQREKIAKDFFDLFEAEKANAFYITIGGNVSLLHSCIL